MSGPMETVLTGDGYTVALGDHGVIALKGILRLNGMSEYEPIVTVLNKTAAGRSSLTIDVSELEFLNSSGIAMLSRFVIEARNAGLGLRVAAADCIPWQGKSLRNLQRLMPALDLVFG